MRDRGPGSLAACETATSAAAAVREPLRVCLDPVEVACLGERPRSHFVLVAFPVNLRPSRVLSIERVRRFPNHQW
jgi:hypothetical protein